MTAAHETLRALASKATRGPWGLRSPNGTNHTSRTLTIHPHPNSSALATIYGPYGHCDADGEYIAACSPDVVLGLLDALSDAERERYRLREAFRRAELHMASGGREKLRLEAESDAAREDAAALRAALLEIGDGSCSECHPCGSGGPVVERCAHLIARAALDAAGKRETEGRDDG